MKHVLWCAALLAGLASPAFAQSPAPMPFDLGGPFALTDQTGASRTQADPGDQPQLLFFGYANCREICSAVLPLMGDVADVLATDGIHLSLVMITVDPENDTVEAIGPALTAIHPGIIGLTGDDAMLQVAYDAFNVTREVLFQDPAGQPIYAHGSLLYLLNGAGDVQTLFPPILSANRVAEIVRSYVGDAG